MIADRHTYLRSLVTELGKTWPHNRFINIVFHGHSVPAGYFLTPYVNTYGSYPYLLHRKLKERFPFAIINPIVTAIGGENSVQGVKRFETEVLCHKPDLLTIDYGLNDRYVDITACLNAWQVMIEKALERNIPVILLTPTLDHSYYKQDENWELLKKHAEQIRKLAEKYNVGLVDSFQTFINYINEGGALEDLLSQSNHPNEKGHALVAQELARYFPI